MKISNKTVNFIKMAQPNYTYVPISVQEEGKMNFVKVTPVQVTPKPQPNPEQLRGSFVIGSQFVSEAEILTESDSPFLLGVLRAFNSAYRFGFLLSYVTLLVFSFIGAPFFGMLIGFLEFICQGIRALLRPFGKIVADVLGYGTLVNSQNFKNERDLESSLKNV